jgi:hypothetical protein
VVERESGMGEGRGEFSQIPVLDVGGLYDTSGVAMQEVASGDYAATWNRWASSMSLGIACPPTLSPPCAR